MVLADYANSLEKERDHFKVKLNGVGLDCGKGVIIDALGVCHGEVFNKAYHLGEDVCEKGSIIFTDNVLEKIKDNPSFENVNFINVEEDGEFVGYRFELDGKMDALNYELVHPSHDKHLPEDLLFFAARHDPTSDIK